MPARRIADEPGYVLHHYDWSESSLILEVFTRHHGRIALVAKGAKKPSSNFRPVLLPLQPLHLAFGGDAEIRTLRGAEWIGGHVMPSGDALLAGYYLNELLLRMLARDDPHPALFDGYVFAVRVLAAAHGEALEPALRAFELLLLREAGLLPALDQQTLTLGALEPGARYALVPEGGLRLAGEGDGAVLAGVQWTALERALESGTPFAALLSACVGATAELKAQLRTLLHYHCGVTSFKTRQLMLDIQSL
ncbi:MAG: DNA repair protein RecO [Proteobacteria bacterium]|nr:DNA repair protein RecO [Pseudomonadota bacterium]